MFRTPVEALKRADGSVQCGECSSVFVALKHALLLDSPIVAKISSAAIELNPQRSRNGAIFIAIIFGLVVAAVGVSHVGLQKNAFSLDYFHTIAPAYKVVGVPLPLYQGIDAFVLGQSSLKKDDDQSIRLSFTLYNRGGVATAWPKLKVVLLGASGQTTYEVVTNVDDLLPVKPTDPVGPLSNVALEAHISAEKAKNSETYRLEVVER